MTRGVRMFLALLNAPFALVNLTIAITPSTDFGVAVLHALAFAFCATVGLWIWTDK